MSAKGLFALHISNFHFKSPLSFKALVPPLCSLLPQAVFTPQLRDASRPLPSSPLPLL